MANDAKKQNLYSGGKTAENNLGNKGLFENFFNTFIEFLILK